MPALRRILIPVDGTAASERAIPCARDLARQLDAEVLVCHVAATAAGTRASGLAVDSARYVTEVAQRFRDGGVSTRTQVRRGNPAFEIKAAAIEWGCDLIVMATRSRRGIEKLVLGSVADAVVRESSLPVLLVSTAAARARRESEAA
jgi:nucleotide-binding universal stress UspA family protein